ncbi:glycosyltransferase family 4 protein [Haladaptatus sp. DYSN1]|uniref:glycosyltransferase family 4 protein n=1 Tax=unclassified Haladaptatus TaxID=2622732 RepID=UPI002406ED2B|nr:glycosyltransferase family 4 protein [Haladaptatus sp. DYSN1]
MSPKHSKTVFVITTSDISHARGNTEPYYITNLLTKRYDTHVFGPLSRGFTGAHNHTFPFGDILGVFLLNVLFVPYWVYVSVRYRPDVVFCHREVIVPPYVCKLVAGSAVVYDIRMNPYRQGIEFVELDHIRNPAYRTFLTFSLLAHRLALPNADAVITLSESLAAQLREDYRVRSEQLHLVPLGVDTDKFRPAEPADGDDLELVYAGAIYPIRRLHLVAEAISMLPEAARERVRLDLYGDADEAYIDELETTARAGGWADRLTWHGYVNHEQLAAKLGHHDVALSPLPPIESFEVSSPAKMYEYLAFGLPIIATRITPHVEVLTDGEDALIVEPESPAAIRDAIETFLDSPDLVVRMTQTAREHSLAHSWDARFETVVDAIEGRPPQPSETTTPPQPAP